MVDIYLIRHAESEMQLLPGLICGRSPETPLTPRGVRQAQLLRARLIRECFHFDEVGSSPAVRAYRTMDIARYPGIKKEDIIIEAELHEMNKGDWDGCERSLIATPKIRAQIQKEGMDFVPPNGESPRQVGIRMEKWALGKVEAHKAESYSLARVTSTMAICCVLQKIFRFDEDFVFRVGVANTSITHVSYSRGWRLLTFDDSTHLREMPTS